MERGDLLDQRTLEDSPVVANSRMNRERELTGTNSYAKELRFDPLQWLQQRNTPGSLVSWLDLCCGTGRALVQAAEGVERAGGTGHIRILGLDLVPMFTSELPRPGLELRAASLHDWDTDERFDLITCVHGLHYLGDKLGLIERAAAWLKPDGLFVAHLDLQNLRKVDGAPLGSAIGREFRLRDVDYNRTSHLVRIKGRRELRFPFRFCGADDTAGPNFTRQSAVNSHYESVVSGRR